MHTHATPLKRGTQKHGAGMAGCWWCGCHMARPGVTLGGGWTQLLLQPASPLSQTTECTHSQHDTTQAVLASSYEALTAVHINSPWLSKDFMLNPLGARDISRIPNVFTAKTALSNVLHVFMGRQICSLCSTHTILSFYDFWYKIMSLIDIVVF